MRLHTTSEYIDEEEVTSIITETLQKQTWRNTKMKDVHGGNILQASTTPTRPLVKQASLRPTTLTALMSDNVHSLFLVSEMELSQQKAYIPLVYHTKKYCLATSARRTAYTWGNLWHAFYPLLRETQVAYR